MKTTLSIALTTLLLVAAARAQSEDAEKKVKKADLPAPVLDAVTRKYPKAKLRKFGEELDEGKKVYEVELTDGKDQVSIDVTPEGKILAEETVIAPATLPAPIKAALQASRYKGWRISKAETVVHDEKPDTLVYEVVVQSKNEKFEVVLDRSGKITKEEAKSPKDRD
jgi:uncharacterized membrane protein YkoI